jgi:integrase
MVNLSHYVVYMLLASCASTQTTGNTSSSTYSEDLSHLHPVFEEPVSNPITQANPEKRRTEYVEPKFTVNESLHTILDSIDRINLNRRLIDGFSIQVYSGQKREEALNAKRTMDLHLPEMNAQMVYVQPTFRIKAGKYYTQLDAQKEYVAVKRYFPNAILIPDKISFD